MSTVGNNITISKYSTGPSDGYELGWLQTAEHGSDNDYCYLIKCYLNSSDNFNYSVVLSSSGAGIGGYSTITTKTTATVGSLNGLNDRNNYSYGRWVSNSYNTFLIFSSYSGRYIQQTDYFEVKTSFNYEVSIQTTSATWTGGSAFDGYVANNPLTGTITIMKYYHQVYFDENGGTGHVSSIINVTDWDKYGTYTGTIPSNQPTKQGFTFKGWGTSRDATTPSYYPGQTYTFTNLGLKFLYAIWEADEVEHTLNYDANGGTGAPSYQTITNTSSSSFTATISSTVPTRTNYKFLGWSLDSSATTATWQPGDTVTFESLNATVYAIWEKISLYIKISGTWQPGIPYIKVSGTWERGSPSIKVNDSWST